MVYDFYKRVKKIEILAIFENGIGGYYEKNKYNRNGT